MITLQPPPPRPPDAPGRHVVVVTGLSGAGKASILRALEDLGYETVDNPPLSILGSLITEDDASPLAVGVDTRSRGFDGGALTAGLAALRARGDLDLRMVFATADTEALLRRYSETRRRHPLAPEGSVAEGIAREAAILEPLREEADWVVDTTGLPLPDLRRMVEQQFRPDLAPGMSVAVKSFGFPHGVPREADLVFDLRFLRNPHYDPILRPMTGKDAPVAAFIEADPDFPAFWGHITALLDPLLPRYGAEGKKYLTVAVGCTGGKHRSVLVAERLGAHLARAGWRVDLSHRELRLPPVALGVACPADPAKPAAPFTAGSGSSPGPSPGPEPRTHLS